ncbi:hypothetical protein DH2020_044354 [Rehmannia glutinosa]|uniref:F-box associated beta-propeller type 3 domain-containing protein n=1 Tax=Rehmannia glutinosa TaxID=99300 RepID=A0ABR0UHX9_REHGL
MNTYSSGGFCRREETQKLRALNSVELHSTENLTINQQVEGEIATKRKRSGFYRREKTCEETYCRMVGSVGGGNVRGNVLRETLKLEFNKRPSDIRIICSCNGLLLCSTTRDCNNLARRYYVYNPTSNKFSTLPKLDGEEDWISSQICGMNLAFDPAKSPHYKVVCIRSWRYMYQLEVYSSETGGPWRKCGEPFKAQVIFQTGVYWNGAIHWIMNGFRNSLHFWDSRDSLYFNVDDEILRVMPLLPLPDASNWKSNYRFWESCDHLHYIIDIIRSSISFNVYEMRQDYSEWFIKYRVDLSPVVAAFPEMIRSNPINFYMDWRNRPIYALCSLVRGEKDEDSFLVLNIEGKAIRYNIVYQTFETIFEFVGAEVEGRERFLGRIGYQYIESLCGV